MRPHTQRKRDPRNPQNKPSRFSCDRDHAGTCRHSQCRPLAKGSSNEWRHIRDMDLTSTRTRRQHLSSYEGALCLDTAIHFNLSRISCVILFRVTARVEEGEHVLRVARGTLAAVKVGKHDSREYTASRAEVCPDRFIFSYPAYLCHILEIFCCRKTRLADRHAEFWTSMSAHDFEEQNMRVIAW